MDEPGVFHHIFDRYHTMIWKYLAARVGCDMADDLASETFAIAFDKRAGYNPAWIVCRPWLYGIAERLVLGKRRSDMIHLRGLARTAARDSDSVQNDGHEDVTINRLDATAHSTLLMHAVRKLKPGDRQALMLFAVGGLSYAEAAAALDIPEGTVRSRLNRARKLIVGRLPEGALHV